MEDLKDFETLEVVKHNEEVDNEEEWKSIGEEEFEEIMSEPQSTQNEGGFYYDLRNFALYHAKITRGGELKLPCNKTIGHKKYE